MSTALAVLEVQQQQTRVDARKLQASMGLVGDFSHWIAYQIERFQLVEGKDFGISANDNGYSAVGKPRKNYWLSLNTAKMIALSQNSPQARAAHQELIRLEEKWNTPELIYARALQLANAALSQYQQEIQAFQPKLIAHDRFIEAGHLYSFTQSARKLGVGMKEFIVWLQTNRQMFVRWTDKNGKNYYEPFADVRRAGWLESKTGTVENGYTYDQTKVTAAGLSHYATILKKSDKDGRLSEAL